VAYKLELPTDTNAHPVFHVSLLKQYHNDCVEGLVQAVPEPVQVDNQVEYVVDNVLDHRASRGRDQYLVHWLGYGIDDTA
jgi:Chromo (CHRromatin Organisation MOdifier) domain